jgi:transcription elongation GreA/GreB family factor
MDKQLLLEKIIEKLLEEADLYMKAARAAHAEATHEQSKAENKYDTRGLEASYLARGQSKQAAEIELSIKEYRKLPARKFTDADAIDVGAYFELQGRNETNCYFLGPRAGGTEIEMGKKEITVITPQSPLGAQLIGHKLGEKLKIEMGGQKRDFKVTALL